MRLLKHIDLDTPLPSSRSASTACAAIYRASWPPSTPRFRAGVVDSCQFDNCPTHRHKEVEFLPGRTVLFSQLVRCVINISHVIGKRCKMSTQSLPAPSLRTGHGLPAVRWVSRVVNYLIYQALWLIMPAISGSEPSFSLLSGRRRARPCSTRHGWIALRPKRAL